jgi:hypothetical protein
MTEDKALDISKTVLAISTILFVLVVTLIGSVLNHLFG